MTGERAVDPGVDGVGGEVEDQRGRGRCAAVGAVRLAAQPPTGADPPAPLPQPAASAARSTRAKGRIRRRRIGLRRIVMAHAPEGHVQPQSHALALANVPLLLQVLLVRDPPAAPPRATRRSSRCSTGPPVGTTSRSFSCSPARRPITTPAWPPAWPSTASRISPPTWCGRASARSSGGSCPTPTLASSTGDELQRLREVTASQGLMLESINPDLVVHQGSPTKHPALRLETIAAAGDLKIPFTSGILVGIGETEEERIAALEAIARVHETPWAHPGGDPPELRPPPELLRARAGRDRRRGGAGVLAHRGLERAAARRAGLGDSGGASRTSSG